MICEKLFILMMRLLSSSEPAYGPFLIFFLFAGLMRPSSETGARPKTSVTSAAASTSLTTTNGQDQAESEEGADHDDHVSITLNWTGLFQQYFFKGKDKTEETCCL